MGKTQEDAGVLTVGGEKITEGAKKKFIDDVMDQLRYGDAGFSVPFLTPCGPEIPPAPDDYPIPNLHDEKKFGDWQKNALGTYHKVASTLNMPGQTPFLPIIFDPIHIAAQLGLPMPSLSLGELAGLMMNVPGLLLTMEIMPPDIPAKLPDIVGLLQIPPGVPVPDIPVIDPSLVALLSDLPTLTIDPILQLPKIFLGLIGKFPTLAIDLLTLSLTPLCELALEAFMTPNGPNPVLQVATSKVLAIKTGECLAIDLVGVTLGSASGGATGALGQEFGYVPPPWPGGAPESTVRDKIVSFAQTMRDTSWGDPETRNTYVLGVLPNWIYKNDGDPSLGVHADTDGGRRGEPGTPKPSAINYARGASSCGMFVRGALISAGASGDRFFTERYREGSAISGLIRVARERGAMIFDRSRGEKEVPAFKKGDFVIIGDVSGHPNPLHAQLMLQDYSGGTGTGIDAMGGGYPDPKNKVAGGQGELYGSKIMRAKYKIEKMSRDGLYQYPFAGPESGAIDASDDITGTNYLRPILAIIDSEKLINFEEAS